jgi:hypothetical protein
VNTETQLRMVKYNLSQAETYGSFDFLSQGCDISSNLNANVVDTKSHLYKCLSDTDQKLSARNFEDHAD